MLNIDFNTIVSWIFDLLLAAAVFATLIIPYGGDVMYSKLEYDDKSDLHKEKRRPTKRFAWLVGIAALAYILTLAKESWKENMEDEKAAGKDSLFKKELYVRDSIAAVERDSSVARAVGEIATSLAQYNLRIEREYDSLYKVVRDSARSVINNMQITDGTVGFCLGQSLTVDSSLTIKHVTDESFEIELLICAQHGVAKDIDLEVFILMRADSLYFAQSSGPALFPGSSLSPGVISASSFIVKRRNTTSNDVMVYLVGTFSNSSGSTKKFTDDLKMIDITSGAVISVPIDEITKIRRFLNRRHPPITSLYKRFRLRL